ncbi:MAG: peptidase M23 [Rhodospirillaceae bacterium]|nr:peptidase M23 [Rhodospirillaceae bacterium]|tara:strand:+ start:274 stop:1578 length:1305 start_codon:yes stop_codon:yes gene_type:complete
MPRQRSATLIFIAWLFILGGTFSIFEVVLPSHEHNVIPELPEPILAPKVDYGHSDSSSAPSKAPEPKIVQLMVKQGDTLMKLLVSNGVDKQQAANLVSSVRKQYDLRFLKAGQKLKITLAPDYDESAPRTKKIVAFSLMKNFAQEVYTIRTAEDQFTSEIIKKSYQLSDVHVTGRITTSLYKSAVDSGLPLKTLMELIRIFSFDVDFQREIQQGDTFSVLFKSHKDDHGKVVHHDSIDWTKMTLGGKVIEYARFTSKNGFNDYYDRHGKSVKKTLMRTPIDGAKLTSRFGKRRHPILGFTKMHRGVDFAASKGTPIMAAGDGVIESLGRNGPYGKYIRIRHNSTYKTAYAHLSKYKKGLRKGRRVRQGAIIGYVGSTGRSTGPHLHYEVIKNGRKTNPLSVRLPAGNRLNQKDLKKFMKIWSTIDERILKVSEG